MYSTSNPATESTSCPPQLLIVQDLADAWGGLPKGQWRRGFSTVPGAPRIPIELTKQLQSPQGETPKPGSSHAFSQLGVEALRNLLRHVASPADTQEIIVLVRELRLQRARYDIQAQALDRMWATAPVAQEYFQQWEKGHTAYDQKNVGLIARRCNANGEIFPDRADKVASNVADRWQKFKKRVQADTQQLHEKLFERNAEYRQGVENIRTLNTARYQHITSIKDAVQDLLEPALRKIGGEERDLSKAAQVFARIYANEYMNTVQQPIDELLQFRVVRGLRLGWFVEHADVISSVTLAYILWKAGWQSLMENVHPILHIKIMMAAFLTGGLFSSWARLGLNKALEALGISELTPPPPELEVNDFYTYDGPEPDECALGDPPHRRLRDMIPHSELGMNPTEEEQLALAMVGAYQAGVVASRSLPVLTRVRLDWLADRLRAHRARVRHLLQVRWAFWFESAEGMAQNAEREQIQRDYDQRFEKIRGMPADADSKLAELQALDKWVHARLVGIDAKLHKQLSDLSMYTEHEKALEAASARVVRTIDKLQIIVDRALPSLEEKLHGDFQHIGKDMRKLITGCLLEDETSRIAMILNALGLGWVKHKFVTTVAFLIGATAWAFTTWLFDVPAVGWLWYIPMPYFLLPGIMTASADQLYPWMRARRYGTGGVEYMPLSANVRFRGEASRLDIDARLVASDAVAVDNAVLENSRYPFPVSRQHLSHFYGREINCAPDDLYGRMDAHAALNLALVSHGIDYSTFLEMQAQLIQEGTVPSERSLALVETFAILRSNMRHWIRCTGAIARKLLRRPRCAVEDR